MTHKEMKYFWVENQSVSDRNPMIFWEVITLKLPLGLHLDCKKWYAGVRKKFREATNLKVLTGAQRRF